jgi:thiamine biosynthesis protein ThiI
VVKQLADLWLHGQRPRFHAVDFDLLSRDLQARTGQRYWQVILKRLMLRAAAGVASETGGMAIVTGEAVGQVSSQTLANLAVITEATSLPVLRPLVGANKDEIVALARHIGTFELSSVVGEYCAMVPRRPATAATLAAVRAEEERLDPSLLERAVAERAVLDLARLDLDQQSDPSLEVGEIPPDAVVLDLRTKAAYESWHWPDALFLDFANALRAWPHFDRSRRYVLYCEFGLKSAHAAELMRRGGLDARHVAGGAPRLQGRRERP